MGKKLLFLIVIGFGAIVCKAQDVQKPKVVIGIVVDQMRADYLETFNFHYSQSGFNRLKENGTWFKSCYINYLPSYTGPGHACIYTGSVPAIHGIVGNNWYDVNSGGTIYCVQDTKENAVGGTESSGHISPRNMKVTSVADELRLATNNRSRTFAVSLKDRGAVLPGGHTSNASYWMDDEKGHFMSSTFFMNKLPAWVEDFNGKNYTRTYLNKGWDLNSDYESYLYQQNDKNEYEGEFGDEKRSYFPYSFKNQKNGYIKRTPYGNSILFDFARKAILNEKIGHKGATDFLALSFSATDYVGHIFGPNSLEVEDTYVRFDQDLQLFLHFLDQQYGQDNYVLFLTADHGAAHNPSYLIDKKVPADYFFAEKELLSLNAHLEKKFKMKEVCAKLMNGQVYLNEKIAWPGRIDSYPVSKRMVIEEIVEYFNKHKAIQMAFAAKEIATQPIPYLIKELFLNSYYLKRSGDVSLLFHPSVLDAYSKTGTSHGAWSPYDTKIPLLFYGQGIEAKIIKDKVYMTDIAPTLASILGITPPNGSIGNVILNR